MPKLEIQVETGDLIKTFFADNESSPHIDYPSLYEELDEAVKALGPIIVINVSDTIVQHQESEGGRRYIDGISRIVVYRPYQD